MLDFSVGDIAGAFGVDSKIGGLDLDKINVGEVLGLGEGSKKKKKKSDNDGDENSKFSTGSIHPNDGNVGTIDQNSTTAVDV